VPASPFVFRKVLYLVEATGRRAGSLDEMLRALALVDSLSVGYHMHREFLAHKFVHKEHTNDFADWVARVLGDQRLAERLDNLVAFQFRSLESLRGEIARLIAEHLVGEPAASALRVPPGREFYFTMPRSVVMETGLLATDLPSFAAALQAVPASSIYFHLFETRFAGADGRENDFAEWISGSLGLPELAQKVAQIDPYMFSLEQARRKLMQLVAAAGA
jgi:hypothetical protein